MPPYEVKVSVGSLEDASKVIRILAEGGFSNVSMTPVAFPPQSGLPQPMETFRKLNVLVLAALYQGDAKDRQSAITSEGILQNLRKIPESDALFRTRSEGIISRTVSLLASAVLGDKYGWVACEKTEPRRFWLTERGLDQAKTVLGSGTT